MWKETSLAQFKVPPYSSTRKEGLRKTRKYLRHNRRSWGQNLSPGPYACRSRWSRCLKRGSAAARLLGLGVRTTSGAWMSMSRVCCMLSRRGLWDRPIPHPEEYYRVLCLCDLETSTRRRPRPSRAVEPLGWGWKCLQTRSRSVSHSTVDCYTQFYLIMRTSVSSIQPLIHNIRERLVPLVINLLITLAKPAKAQEW
jgi:hypothetical protein